MKHCSQCVLPETFPGISFDDAGRCNYCTSAFVADDDKKDHYYNEFLALLDKHRGKGQYDVIVAYSGGKDSTKTLIMLAKELKMNCLAWTFDNGFLSDRAKQNITAVADSVGATSLIYRPPFKDLKKAFQIASQNDIYNAKTLDRASSICTTCIGLVKSLILKTALEKKIPLVAYGWSPGQAPIASAIRQNSAALHKMSDRTVKDVLLKHAGNALENCYLSEEDYAVDKAFWPVNIHPLAFTPYNEEKIIEEIAEYGWQKPDDTDANSTNCTLNALANYIHRRKFNFHPYAWEIAGIVRSGSMHRAEGIDKTTQEENLEMVNYGAKMLDITID